MPTTTIKISDRLKARIARLAKGSGRSAHSLMIGALERQVTREEKIRDFVREAQSSDADVEAGGHVYRAEDVHAWLLRLSRRGKSARPKPWRE